MLHIFSCVTPCQARDGSEQLFLVWRHCLSAIDWFSIGHELTLIWSERAIWFLYVRDSGTSPE